MAVSTAYLKTQIPDVETNFGNNFNLDVSGNFGFVSSYSAKGLPKGLTIDSSSGAISGAPTKSGNFTVTVTALDSAPPSAIGCGQNRLVGSIPKLGWQPPHRFTEQVLGSSFVELITIYYRLRIM
ncbi:MAG: putative Ig domain-containing protein [Hormoscilla sp. SP5CHS1]|nr:putative Ig domain-containing protein [Hormoscilla sp. SP12CHS1]MBC6451958.1 putative Ig domain-containing protein [Hormoscilla sp. SP5CHS1]